MEKPEFRVMKNGYDRFAVDQAVSNYILEIENLQKKIDLYNRQTVAVTEQLNTVKVRYQSLVSEITVKEKAAEELSLIALREANIIIGSAQNNADSIVKEAISTARLILVDLTKLSSEVTGMKSDVQKQLETLLQNFDDFKLPTLPALEWLEKIEIEKKQ